MLFSFSFDSQILESEEPVHFQTKFEELQFSFHKPKGFSLGSVMKAVNVVALLNLYCIIVSFSSTSFPRGVCFLFNCKGCRDKTIEIICSFHFVVFQKERKINLNFIFVRICPAVLEVFPKMRSGAVSTQLLLP